MDRVEALDNFLTTSVFNKHPTNYQPNVFTESRQEFTELEKKIVVLVVNQIGHMSLKGEIRPGANVKFQIPYTELTKQRYDQISAAAETLQLKRLMYRNDKTEKFHFIVPFPSIKSEIINGKKMIELTMFADVVPHFAELGQRYTKYDIDVMLSLTSVYAQRMFEIVSMYSNRGQKQFNYTVNQLRTILNCPESYRYVDFKINALELAKRELHQKANIILEWEPTKKEGKKIIELTFTIKTSQQLASEGVQQDQQIVNQMSISEAIPAAWQLMTNYKLKAWQKDLIIADHSLLDIFFRVNSELTNGLRPKVKNHTAYLVKSLGIDQLKAPKQKPAGMAKSSISAPSLFAPGPTLRKDAPQSIADIFGNMMNK